MQRWNTNEVKHCEGGSPRTKDWEPVSWAKCHLVGQVGMLPVVQVCQIHQASEFTDMTEHHVNKILIHLVRSHTSQWATKAEVKN